MKRIIVAVTMLILISLLTATGITVSLSDVVGIGGRNATQMWGNVHSAPPIPLYGPDEDIIAYYLNYSLEGVFPDAEVLKTQCEEAMNRGNRDEACGAGKYGSMVIGAKPYMPVFIRISPSLSEQFVQGRKLEKAAREAFPEGYTIGKAYYLGYVNVWYQIYDKNNTKKYINLVPSPKTISEEEFTKLKGEIVYFWTRSTFEDEWQQFMTNRETIGRSAVIIEGEDKMPFYEWSYGCTPTSGAMILAWWDHHRGMGRFVSSHYDRWDSVIGRNEYHVPTIQHQLAQAMDTGAGGTTYLGDVIDAYYEVVEDNGYRCVCDGLWAPHHTDTTLFEGIQDQIDQGLPCQVGIWGHTLAGVGYNTSPKLVYVHDPNDSVLNQIHKSFLWDYFYVHVYDDSGNNGVFMELTDPNGGTRYNSDWSEDILLSGSLHEILWDSPHGNTMVSLSYSLDAGEHWSVIESRTENDGSYCWLVPDLNPLFHPEGRSDKGRIRLNLFDHNDEKIAADGSYGNFHIRPGGSFPLLGPSYSFNLPKKFAQVNHNGNSWGVVAVKSDNDENRCSVELFDDPLIMDFENSVMLATGHNITNYVVIDNRTLPENTYGVKFSRIYPNGGSNSVKVGFKNIPSTLSLGAYTFQWPENETAKIYDIWLEPGNHYFQLNAAEETADLDFALFKSGGTGIFNRDGAVARSEYYNEGYNESFQYTVTEAGYYGLVITSNSYISTSFYLLISNSSVWRGTDSRNWHWAGNWLPQGVPGPNDAVVIPSGCPNYPLITSVNAPMYTQCKSLLIKYGASLTVDDRSFEVVGDMRVFGKVHLIDSTTEFLVSGSVTWENLGTLAIDDEDAKFLCYGHWTTNVGSYFTAPYRGKVEFISGYSSNIACHSSSFSFPSLSLNKTGGATVTYNAGSSHDLVVENELYIGANSSFRSNSVHSIVAKGNFATLGNFAFEAGTVRLLGQFGTLICPAGSYFHSLDISTSIFTTLLSDIRIKGDFTINSSSFLAGDYTIYVGGDWRNNVGAGGFQKGSSTVIFDGTGLSACYGENFANLKINNADCELTFVEGTSSIDSYTWMSGALAMGGGTLTINDMPYTGINGIYHIAGGTLNLHQNSYHPVDLVGTYQILAGTMNIYGGLSPSVWTNGGDLNLLMRGGILDFKDVGINVSGSYGTALNLDITDGVIRTAGDFICTRTNFNPAGGSVELYGTGISNVSITSPSAFANLIINKDSRIANEGTNSGVSAISSSSDPSRTSQVNLLTNLNIASDLMIPVGTFDLGGKTVVVGNDLEVFGKLKMTSANDLLKVYSSVYWYDGSSSEITNGIFECYKDWNFMGGTANLQGSHTTIFKGEDPSIILTIGVQAFANLRLAKTSLSYQQNLVSIATNLNINGNLEILDRSKLMPTAANVTVAGTITHSASPDFYVADGSSVTCNDLVLNGHLMVDGGTFSVQDDFTTGAGSQLSIEAGNFILDAPYTGNFIGITNYIVLNGGTFQITNEGIQFGPTSNFVLGGGKLKLGWGLKALSPSSFMPTVGSIEFFGSRSASLELATGNYLHNVLVTKTGTGTLILGSNATINNLTINSGSVLLNHHSLQVNGNVNIVSGNLNGAFFDDYISVYGNWTNSRGSAGFIEGTGTVAFVGNGRSILGSNETFNILQIHKPMGLAYPLEVGSGFGLTANSYEYITGVMVLMNGSILNTPASGFVLPNGSGLRCVDGYSIINLNGNFIDYNTVINSNNGFYSGASTVNVLGAGNRQIVSSAFRFNNLNVNLSGGGNCYINNYQPEFTGNVNLQSGTISAEYGSSFTFHNGLNSSAGTTLALAGCTLTFVGANDSQLGIGGAADYWYIMVAKEIGSAVQLSSSLNMPANASLMVQQGILKLNSMVLKPGADVIIGSGAEILANANSQLLMPANSTLNVNSGGLLTAIGSSSQPALISRNGESYYNLYVNSGASIAAEYAIFENMDYSGVTIYSGATVIPEHSFNYCTFRNGGYGGRLLYIDNDQNLTITGAVFPQNTWNGMSNVAKYANTGSIRFLGESGAFSGPTFESDPYNRINWNYQNPTIAVNPGSLSFGSVNMPMSEFRTLTITNSGSGSLAGSLLMPDDFTASIVRNEITSNSSKIEENQRSSRVDFLVLPGSSIQVSVVFIPTEPITYNSTMVITHNVSENPVNISLTGMGIGAQVTVNPIQIVKGILPSGSHTEAFSITDSGNASLSYYADIHYPTRSGDVILSESFETSFPPSGWSTYAVNTVNTAGVWDRNNMTVHPNGINPQSGNYLAYFNSWTCAAGNQTRLQTGNLLFTDYSNVNLSFWMYHEAGYSAYNDRIQIQISRIQGNWENVGEPILRYSTTNGWQQHNISLSAYANQSNLSLGFLGISQYGNDIHIDNVVITGSNPPTGWVHFNGQNESVYGVLSPGAANQYQVNIDTSDLEVGTYQAEIWVASNDPINSTKIVPITVSVGTPGLSVNPTYLPYPILEVGSESLYGLYLTNSGSIHLRGTIILPAGYHIQPMAGRDETLSTFSQSAGRWTNSEAFILAPGQASSFVVRFAPTAVQSYNGNIIIDTDNLADILVPVSGSGGIVPVVSTNGVGDVANNSITLYGAISDTGGMTITEKGFYYGTDSDPREYGERIISNSTGNSISAPITGLESSTQYYYCAYADNAMGTGVGDVYIFNTTGPEVNVSTTNLPSFGNVQISTSSVAQSFNISGSDLLGDVTISVPTGFRLTIGTVRADNLRSDNQLVLSPTNGDLAASTINVFFQPIAVALYTGIITISCEGVADQTISVSGNGITSPTIATSAISSITGTSAESGGNVVSDGGLPVLARGVCWSRLPNPTLANSYTTNGAGTGTFYSSITALLPGTIYYLRAYTTNSLATYFGENVVFETLADAPASAPANIRIQIEGAYIVLSWDAVPNASSYRVMSAPNPDADYAEDNSGTYYGNSWRAPITENTRFYHVIAISGTASRFVPVPAGTFTMGRHTGAGDPDEVPAHTVTLSAFYMGKFEVTQGEWNTIMGSNPATGYGVGELYPIYNVSWYSVLKYCNLRSMAEGLSPVYTINGSTNPANWGAIPLGFNNAWDSAICNFAANGYRLPTEAEWEYAARATTNDPYYLYSGSNDIDAVAWYYGDGSANGNKPIGGKAPNALGLYDMSGNVNELCWDFTMPYTTAAVENPTGAISGVERIRRGGFWDSLPFYCRVVQRDSSYPFVTSRNLGFRLCKSNLSE